MRRSLWWAGAVFGMIASSALAAKLDDGTFIFNNTSSAARSSYTLRRSGGELLIVDDATNKILAQADASQVERVIVRGMPGAHDDTLNIDLSAGFSVDRGISFDGGAGGFDSMNIKGGSAAQTSSQQRSPHDGTVHIDALTIHYANIEPLSDTVAAATLTVTGTAGNDTVTITTGPGAGEMTISSPSFESVTFSNKTQVTFDGNGGTDTVTWSATTLATGLSTFIVQNVQTVTQTTAILVPNFAASATGAITLTNAGNDTSNVEFQSVSGTISYNDANAFTVGGVTAALTGIHVTTAGSVLLGANGSISLADTDGLDKISSGASSGDVTIQVNGGTSDVAATTDGDAITSAAGNIMVTAGRDILFGTAGLDYDNDVRASGGVSLSAGRTVQIDGFSDVAADDFGNNTGAQASAHATTSVLISNVYGDDASFGNSGTGITLVTTDPGGTVSITAPTPGAMFSNSSLVAIAADHLIIDPSSGITAGAEVRILTVLAGDAIDLGSTTDVAVNTVEVSDAEVDRVFAPLLTLQAVTGPLTVTQPISFANALQLRGEGLITKSGTGSLAAPSIMFTATDATLRTWTVTPTDVTLAPGTAIPYTVATNVTVNGGTGNDSFSVTPSATTTMTIFGNLPNPPVGDSLTVNLAGTTSPALSYTSSGTGYAGAYTFGNRQPVNFSQIEALGPPTDVSIVKTDGSTSATAGSPVQYTITVTELGGLGTAVTVADTFPATLSNISWTCAASSGGICAAGGTGNINSSATIAANGTLTYTVNATVNSDATGTLNNTATATLPAGETDSNLANNSSSDSDTLVANADLSITKTVDTTSPQPGDQITYTITVSNAGPSDAVTVDVSDTIPAGATLVSAVPSQGSCSGDPAVVCNLGTLAASGSATITLVVTGQTGATFTNTATVTSPTDTTPGNNSGSAPAVTVLPIAPALSGFMLLLLASLLGAAAVIVMKR
jgi:uncharacterized repeat protein (TIGR01451 family)